MVYFRSAYSYAYQPVKNACSFYLQPLIELVTCLLQAFLLKNLFINIIFIDKTA